MTCHKGCLSINEAANGSERTLKSQLSVPCWKIAMVFLCPSCHFSSKCVVSLPGEASHQALSQVQRAAAASLRRNYFAKALNAAVDIYKVSSSEASLRMKAQTWIFLLQHTEQRYRRGHVKYCLQSSSCIGGLCVCSFCVPSNVIT